MELETARNQLGVQLSADPPEWIELLPAGPEVEGFDGRRWRNDSPDRIVAAFQRRDRPMVIDWEHATETRAPNGLDAPAAGWVDRLEVRSGAIWGHVKEWTARARQQLAEKAYRFLSPVFQFEKKSGRIVALTSAALTNAPNLRLTALNSRQVTTGKGEIALTYEELQIGRLMGVGEEDLLKTKRADRARAQNAARLEGLLSPEERRVCEAMGVDPDEFLARKRQLA